MKKLQIPQTLDTDNLLRQNPPACSGMHRDKVHFVCDAIYQQMHHLNKMTLKYHGKSQKYFVPLHSDILSHFLGPKYYAAILSWMIYVKIIECDNSYKKGVISLGYRFTTKYRKAPSILVDTAYKMWRRDYVDLTGREHRTQSRHIQQLADHYEGLELNCEVAEWANFIMHDCRTVMGKDGLKTLSSDDEQLRLQFLNTQTAINRYKNDVSKYHHQDNTGHRLHTVITATPKQLRSLVTWNGEGLAQTDISCAAFYFTLYLFNRNNWRHTQGRQRIWKGISCIEPPEFILSNMSLTSSESQAQKGFYDSPFLELVLTGGLYQFLATISDEDQLMAEVASPGMTVKKAVKSLLLAQIFADEHWAIDRSYIISSVEDSKERQARLSGIKKRSNRFLFSNARGKFWEVFRQSCPDAADVYSRLKFFDYGDASKVLMRIETEAILEYACKRISKMLPKVPIFPLYDCIVTTESNVLKVDKLLKESLCEFIGWPPNTELTYWSSYRDRLPLDIRDHLGWHDVD